MTRTANSGLYDAVINGAVIQGAVIQSAVIKGAVIQGAVIKVLPPCCVRAGVVLTLLSNDREIPMSILGSRIGC